MANVLDKFKEDIKGISFVSLGIFASLSLVSFNPEDPSFNSIGQGIKVTNYCGYVGSFLADLLYQAFGVSSWIVVIACFNVAINYFKKKEVKFKNLKFLWGTLLILTTSSLLGLHFPELRMYKNQILLGGIIGLSVSQALKFMFNYVGVSVLLWSMATVLMIFYSEKTVQEIIKGFASLVKLLERRMKTALPPMAKVSEKMSVNVKWPIKKSNKETEKLEKENREKFIKLDKKDELEPQEQLELGQLALLPDEPEDLEIAKAKRRKPIPTAAKQLRKVENWMMPKISLLEDPPASRIRLDEKEIKRKAELLVDKLDQFDVKGNVVAAKPGPAVTMYEFKPNSDVRLSRITDLQDDLSLALSSESLRIIAPIPGRDVVGIETSNAQRETVYLKDLITEDSFWDEEMKLPIPLGKQANGEPKVVDLRKMPHLLVAGTTGSGKSVFTVSTLTGLLFKHSPKTLRLILVDPKQVDLAAFSKVPHLIVPPIREPKKAVSALRWAVKEMEKRYRSMSKFGSRGIEGFNETVSKLKVEELEVHQKANDENEGLPKFDQYYYTPQPYIVIVVEEFGDLMAVDKINVEQVVVRLAQMARACGIHLMLAMQSPRREVVTGLIKTNIPGRISFKVASKMDSRIILDDSGAERLLARGDMLFLSPGVSKPARHHGPWLDEKEITKLTKFWEDQGEPEYDTLALRALEGSGGGSDWPSEGAGAGDSGDLFDDGGEEDEMYDQILDYVSTLKEVSASYLQRKYRLGYPRAARLIELLEKNGVVGPSNGSKPRQVLMGPNSSP